MGFVGFQVLIWVYSFDWVCQYCDYDDGYTWFVLQVVMFSVFVYLGELLVPHMWLYLRRSEKWRVYLRMVHYKGRGHNTSLFLALLLWWWCLDHFLLLILPNVLLIELFLHCVGERSPFLPIYIGMRFLVLRRLCLLRIGSRILKFALSMIHVTKNRSVKY